MAILTLALGLATALVLILDARPGASYENWNASRVWTAAEVGVASLIGGLLWYVIARVVRRLDEIQRGIQQLVEEE